MPGAETWDWASSPPCPVPTQHVPAGTSLHGPSARLTSPALWTDGSQPSPPQPTEASLLFSWSFLSESTQGACSGVKPEPSGCSWAQKVLHRGQDLPRLWDMPPAQRPTRRASVLYLLPAARHVGSCHLGASRSRSLSGILEPPLPSSARGLVWRMLAAGSRTFSGTGYLSRTGCNQKVWR